MTGWLSILFFISAGEVLGRTTFFRRGKDDSPKLLSTLEKVERSDGSSMDVIFAANKYTAVAQQAVNDAIQDYTDFTCLNWRPKTDDDESYVTFRLGEGCNTNSVGARPFGGQVNITLGDGCHEKKVAIHEMMHAAGFFHEMSRRDRDTFIFVNYTNMRSDANKNNFDIYQEGEANTYDAGYDKQSVMHYGRFLPSISIDSNVPILTSREDPNEVLGNRNGFSQTDIDQINAYYNCHNTRGEETIDQVPACNWELEKLSTYARSFDLGTIAGPDDCKKKCWFAKNLKFYYQTSKHENIDGAQLESPSSGEFRCKCLEKGKGAIYPKTAFGTNIDQETHYRVCRYDVTAPTPNPPTAGTSPLTTPSTTATPPTTKPSTTTKTTPTSSSQVENGGPVVRLHGIPGDLSCYEAIASRKYGLSRSSPASLTDCVETCYDNKERQKATSTVWASVTGASFVQENDGATCYCAANRKWKKGRQQGTTCFFTGDADEPVPAPPPVFNPDTIECQQGQKFMSNSDFGFGTDASADSPTKCAQKCHTVKTEGGYSRDVSGIKGSMYQETEGNFSACYCTFSLVYHPESAYSNYDPDQSHTICIL